MLGDQSKCVSVEQEHCTGERCLPVGTLFASPDIGRGEVNIHIPSQVLLTITSATNRDTNASIAEISITTDATGRVPLCNVKACETVSGLDCSLAGPQHVRLSVTTSSSTSSSPVTNVSVLGSISPATYVYDETMLAREDVGADIISKKRRLSNANSLNESSSTDVNKDGNASNRKERRLSNAESLNESPSTNVKKGDENASSRKEQEEGEPTQQTLSKRQRKKLAKKKAKEFAEAVALLNKHEALGDLNKKKKKKEEEEDETEKVTSVTKERRLPSGVYVKDIIVGNGAPVKLGRKVSILYEAAFPNGKVFDKSKNRNNPFTFRQGTGEVIKGLEKGLEGMKVGGEREITIPPEQGYGKAGSGNVVPPNSTLVFSVQLVGLG
jgi:FKBP-type peptidyl-prolyl cis-trans isomerase